MIPDHYGAICPTAKERHDAQRYIATMRILGVTLQLTHGHGRGPIWCLSDGTHVELGCARIMLKDPHITGVGDCLFAGALSQTFRYVET
jgi:hypothetical protein